jgi:hypothetical protein
VLLAVATLLGVDAASPARGATITWTGLGATANWNLVANWSTLTVPGAADVAFFDATSPKAVLMNVNVNVAGIDIGAAYGGTITQGAGRSVTIGASGWSMAGGAFVGSASAITVNGPWSQTGGAYTSTSGTLSVAGSVTQTGGAFVHNGGTLRLTGTASGIDVPGSLVVWNLTLAQGGLVAKTLALGDALVVDGLLTLTNGTWEGGELQARGGINQAAGFDGGGGTLRIDGIGDQLFTGSASASAGALPNVIIAKPSGTLTLAGTIRTLSDWTYLGGGLDAGTSSLVFGGAQTINGSHTLANVELRGANVKDLAPGTTLVVAGLLRLTDGFLDGDALRSQGDIIQAAGFDGGTATLRIDGSGDQLFTGSAAAGAGALPNVVIEKPSGKVSLAGTIRVSNRGWSYDSGMLDPGASLVIFDSGTLISGSHALSNVTLRGAGPTTMGSGEALTVSGTLTLTNGTWDGGELQARGDIAQAAGFDGGSGILRIDGAGDQAFIGAATNSAGLLPAVVIDKPSGTLTVGGTIRSAQNVTQLAGLVDAGTSVLILSGPAVLTIPGVSLHRVDVRGGTAALGSALALNGDLRIVSGQLDTGGNAVDVGGNLIVSGSLDGDGSELQVDGDVTVTGSVIGELDRLILEGTVLQTVNFGGFAVRDLRVDNAGGARLGGDIQVAGTLDLASGVLAIGPHRLSIAEPIAGAAGNLQGGISSALTVAGIGSGIALPASLTDLGELEITNGAGMALEGPLTIHGALLLDGGNLAANPFAVTIAPGGVVSRTSGHVIGTLVKAIAGGGAVSVNFEIGDALGYAPAQVEWPVVTDPGTIAASSSAGDDAGLAAAGLEPNASVNRTWSLTATGLAAESSVVTLSYLPADLDAAADPLSLLALVSSGGTPTQPPVIARTALSASLSLAGTPAGIFALANSVAAVPPPATPSPTSLPTLSPTPAPTSTASDEIPDTADTTVPSLAGASGMLPWLAIAALAVIALIGLRQRPGRR